MLEDRKTAPVSRPSGPQMLSDDVGLDKDLSLYQALNDSKQYESFMQELKEVHRKDSEHNVGQGPQDSDDESSEQDLESAPPNKVVSHLVQ